MSSDDSLSMVKLWYMLACSQYVLDEDEAAETEACQWRQDGSGPCHHHHHHVACPELDVAVPTSLLHACRFCARW